jgi:hypothetical protein
MSIPITLANQSNSGCLKKLAIAGEPNHIRMYKKSEINKLIKKTVLLSSSEIVFSLIKACVKPLSTKLEETAKNTESIAIKPKSAGVNNLANTILTTNMENLVPILEVRVQRKPDKVFCAKDIYS